MIEDVPSMRTLGDLFLQFAKDEPLTDGLTAPDEHVILAGYSCSLVAGRIAHRLVTRNADLEARVSHLEALLSDTTKYNLEITTQCKGLAAAVILLEAELDETTSRAARETACREGAEKERDTAREEAAAAARHAKNRVSAARSARSAAASELASLREKTAQLQEEASAHASDMTRMRAVCEKALRDAKERRDELAAQSQTATNEARAAVVQQIISVADYEGSKAAWYRDMLMGNEKGPGLARALLMARQLEDEATSVDELREGITFMRDSIASVRAECVVYESRVTMGTPFTARRVRSLMELMATSLLNEDATLTRMLSKLDCLVGECDAPEPVKACVVDLHRAVDELVSRVRM